MNLALLSSLISDLDEVIDDAEKKPQTEIPATRKLEAQARDALGDHRRLDEVVGHLALGAARPARTVLGEIRAAAQSAPPAS